MRDVHLAFILHFIFLKGSYESNHLLTDPYECDYDQYYVWDGSIFEEHPHILDSRILNPDLTIPRVLDFKSLEGPVNVNAPSTAEKQKDQFEPGKDVETRTQTDNASSNTIPYGSLDALDPNDLYSDFDILEGIPNLNEVLESLVVVPHGNPRIIEEWPQEYGLPYSPSIDLDPEGEKDTLQKVIPEDAERGQGFRVGIQTNLGTQQIQVQNGKLVTPRPLNQRLSKRSLDQHREQYDIRNLEFLANVVALPPLISSTGTTIPLEQVDSLQQSYQPYYRHINQEIFTEEKKDRDTGPIENYSEDGPVASRTRRAKRRKLSRSRLTSAIPPEFDPVSNSKESVAPHSLLLKKLLTSSGASQVDNSNILVTNAGMRHNSQTTQVVQFLPANPIISQQAPDVQFNHHLSESNPQTPRIFTVPTFQATSNEPKVASSLGSSNALGTTKAYHTTFTHDRVRDGNVPLTLRQQSVLGSAISNVKETMNGFVGRSGQLFFKLKPCFMVFSDILTVGCDNKKLDLYTVLFPSLILDESLTRTNFKIQQNGLCVVLERMDDGKVKILVRVIGNPSIALKVLRPTEHGYRMILQSRPGLSSRRVEENDMILIGEKRLMQADIKLEKAADTPTLASQLPNGPLWTICKVSRNL